LQVALTCTQPERATQVATPPLPAAAPSGVTWGFLAKIPMAAPQGPVCNIRLLIVPPLPAKLSALSDRSTRGPTDD
jgi:hypothetical protein